jgi:hypothetical protein
MSADRPRWRLTPTIHGWDDASLIEFDRRWERGDTILEMSVAFNVSERWVQTIRRRRGLQPREFPWRGGPNGINRRRMA